jgi:hypothetical protein
MKFIKSVKNSGRGFSATYANGVKSESFEAAQFFMAMQDKEAGPDELDGYIRLGKMVDPARDWKEISRIAGSFKQPSAT